MVEFHRGSVQLEFLPACYAYNILMYTLRPLFSKTMYTIITSHALHCNYQVQFQLPLLVVSLCSVRGSTGAVDDKGRERNKCL